MKNAKSRYLGKEDIEEWLVEIEWQSQGKSDADSEDARAWF